MVVGWESNGLVTLPDEWDVNAGYLYGDGEQCVAGGVDFIGYTALRSDPSEHTVWQGRDLVPTRTEVRDEAVSGGNAPSDMQAALGTDSLNCPNLVEK